MRVFVKFLLLSEAFAVMTFGAGWWAVPVVAALWGMFGSPVATRGRFAAACAAFGWGSLLMLHATRGSVSAVASQVGEVMGVPPAALYGLTILFPALLAWSAATLSPVLRRR